MRYDLKEELTYRTLILDGGMGTMVQRYNLSENDYRGNEFAKSKFIQKGNNDLLCLTKPDVICEIHEKYLQVTDIIESCSFNAQRISMGDYGMENQIRRINLAAAKIARKIADEYTAKNPSKPRFVAGSVGRTNKTASISPDVNDPAFRGISFDELVDAYSEQMDAPDRRRSGRFAHRDHI